MSNVIAFPGPKKPVTPPPTPAQDSAPEPNVQSAIAVGAEVPRVPKQEGELLKVEEKRTPVYVRVRADIFQVMLDTIAFYAKQGFDHGEKARGVMDQLFAKEPA